jgi:hypothetical protein
MFNYYLFNESYQSAGIEFIENNLRDLNDLVIDERKEEDSFLLSNSIWNLTTVDGNFAEVVFSKLEDQQLCMTVLPKMFQAIESLDDEISTFESFDNDYNIYNAFYGINFTDLDLTRCIADKAQYVVYREKNLWELNPNSLWERKNILFSKVILCNSVKNDIQEIGGTYLNQILAKLKELDKYAKIHWLNGSFNYGDANQKTSLNISPESKKTMDQTKYYNQRIFSLPDGRRECFELHIKSGNLRFHFFPENGFIYVGYIGKHLDTDKFN